MNDLVTPIDRNPTHAFCAGIVYLIVSCVLFMPARYLFPSVRFAFRNALIRILKPSLADPVYLCDILLADILTSCAKIFHELIGIIVLFVRSLVPPKIQISTDQSATYVRSGMWDFDVFETLLFLEPFITSMPYLIRFRQCINQLLNSSPGSVDAAKHKANAIKYLSALPVIFLARFQKIVMLDLFDGSLDAESHHVFLFCLWIVAAAFNSLYSFYWDLVFDWGMGHCGGHNIASWLAFVFPELSPESSAPGNTQSPPTPAGSAANA
ncbi:protein-ER retention protein, partial [Spiromyces aspiralis]